MASHISRSNAQHQPVDSSSSEVGDLGLDRYELFHDQKTLMAVMATVVPGLFANKRPGEAVRAWIPGCATGEAAYAVAILLHEHALQLEDPPPIQIFATDGDGAAIATARSGRFSPALASNIARERLQRFFLKEQGQYQIKKAARDLIIFAPHHPLRDPPFARLDLIVYMNQLFPLIPDGQELLLVFHRALRPKGQLLLGAGAQAEGLWDLFAEADGTRGLFQRRDVNPRPPRVLVEPLATRAEPALPARLPHAVAAPASVRDLHLELLARNVATSVLVDPAYEIVHLSKRDDHLFQLGAGALSRNLLDVVHPELRLPLRAALQMVAQARASVETPAVPLGLAGVARRISMFVQQLEAREWTRGYLLVIFHERGDGDPGARQSGAGDSAAARLSEAERQHSRQQSWLMIDEYEAALEQQRVANEELQAANEQLQALSEELATSQEQLQTANEALRASNQELRRRIVELTQANNDLDNLMAAADIATIFLDRALRITRFTPQAQGLFNLIPEDCGRPLAHMAHTLDYDQLLQDAERVIATLQGVEREVRSADGHWYLARLRPYRSADDRIDGAALTFVDITARKLAEEAVRQARDELELRVVERTRELATANLQLQDEVAERKQLEAARKQLLRALVTSQEDERRRIARELHDQLGQSLSALRMGLATLGSEAPGAVGRQDMVARLRRIAAQLDEDVDRLALELRPSALDDLGLLVAVQQHVEDWAELHGIAAEFQTARLDAVHILPEIETVLYRVVQEALTNVVKHARARHVSVILERRDEQLRLIVEDDGRGFEPDLLELAPDAQRQLGLLGMRERVALVGGTFVIETAPGAGTTLFVRIPIAPPKLEEHGNA